MCFKHMTDFISNLYFERVILIVMRGGDTDGNRKNEL